MLTALGWDGLGDATVTTDSASVMRATVKSQLRWEWMPCASHVINQAAQRGLAAVDDAPQGDAWAMFRLAQELPTKLACSNVKQKQFMQIHLETI